MVTSSTSGKAAFASPSQNSLREILEEEELSTVGDAFAQPETRKGIFSVARIRQALEGAAKTDEENAAALAILPSAWPPKVRQLVLDMLVRFSFLIELTNVKVGSTKMKTRWLKGLILKPEKHSFQPVKGAFEPGADPRASSFEDCRAVFLTCCRLLTEAQSKVAGLADLLSGLRENNRVPYEHLFAYIDPNLDPCHIAENIRLASLDDLRWLVAARATLKSATGKDKVAINAIIKAKIKVKVYLTDRALTGKDKTNRAKRWEVLAGDFQFATIEDCWSVERKLTGDLVRFHGFPKVLRQKFEDMKLISAEGLDTTCPVTLEPLDFTELANAVSKAVEVSEPVLAELPSGEASGTDRPMADDEVLEEAVSAVHGKSDFQIGHLMPLKKGGRHQGSNVVWQSADGNRIQGDLTIDETFALIRSIFSRLPTTQ